MGARRVDLALLEPTPGLDDMDQEDPLPSEEAFRGASEDRARCRGTKPPSVDSRVLCGRVRGRISLRGRLRPALGKGKAPRAEGRPALLAACPPQEGPADLGGTREAEGLALAHLGVGRARRCRKAELALARP